MSLKEQQFQNPPAPYRGAPLWSWNKKLDKDEVLGQIENFKEMGFGGAHIHVRVGLDTEYLGEEYMDIVRDCVEQAKKQGLYIYLYDEDRWPSGYGGGMVTKNPQFRAWHLLFTPAPYEEKGETEERNFLACFSIGERSGNGVLLGCYDVKLDENGILAGYRKIEKEDQAEGEKWYAYAETNPTHPWYNHQTYVDVLNEAATEFFLETTHEVYREAVGTEFGKTVPSIFTDEPHMVHKTNLPSAQSRQDVFLPWTLDFTDSFAKRYGINLLERLPELFWETKDTSCMEIRYQFHNHLAERFEAAYTGKIASWCKKNGIAFTGHLLFEETLESQNLSAGDLMRSYRNMDIPGMDLLMDEINLTTAKQVQSVVRQYGKKGAMSEEYGVNNYDFDFRDFKFQGDWQAALGITFRVPHLSWLSMKGEAKRDYPPSFNYQSPWYREFKLLEDHFSRINLMMENGKPLVRVAVIHPLENYWCCFGPENQTGEKRRELDEQFQNLTRWLMTNGIDFDYLDEELLPELYEPNSGKVGEMAYEAVILPGLYTLRDTTQDFLNQFEQAGGKIIIAGQPPYLTNGKESGINIPGEQIAFEKDKILEKLAEFQNVKFCLPDGAGSEKYVYQMKEENDRIYLFAASVSKPEEKENPKCTPMVIKVRGTYQAEYMDTMTGEIFPITVSHKNGWTWIEKNVYAFDSLLLCLRKCELQEKNLIAQTNPENENWSRITVPEQVDYELQEQNVVLLDLAEYALDGEAYQPEEEILRIDTALRMRLQYPLRTSFDAQPYANQKITEGHTVRLRYHIQSEEMVAGAKLALEPENRMEILWDGMPIQNIADGWYVDRCIETVSLPVILPGSHMLELVMPFTEKTNLEAAYIIGDFGTRISGNEVCMVQLPRKLHFSSVTEQGLGFYSGNISYKFSVDCPDGKLRIHVPKYRGALIGIFVDGVRKGSVICPPYDLILRDLEPGKHEITLELYGNRYNTFAALHYAAESFKCRTGSMTWRTTGDEWSYEYHLSQFGILEAPEIAV